MKEIHRLCVQGNQEIRERRRHGCGPDQADQHQRSSDGADLHVTKWDADGDVALHHHAGQVQGSVLSGEKCKQDQGTAQRDVYCVDGVADHEEADGQGDLDHVVDDQVNKQYVAWIHVEDLEVERKSTKVGTSVY